MSICLCCVPRARRKAALEGSSQPPVSDGLRGSQRLLEERRVRTTASRSNTDTTEGKYTYAKLRGTEIRILELLPGSFDEEIHCRLKAVRLLKAKGEFEAISYVWGDTKDVNGILCSDYPKLITRSLYGALKHLRYADRARYLWADALCINQDDLDEQSEQVQRMGEIYSSASKVIIWLGEETQEVKGALEELPNWLQKKPPSIRWDSVRVQWESPYTFKFDPENLSKEAIEWLCYQEIVFPRIMHLFARPWWRRKWVIQELLRNDEAFLVCGNSVISWKGLPNAGVEEWSDPYYFLTGKHGDMPEVDENIKISKEGAFNASRLMEWAATYNRKKKAKVDRNNDGLKLFGLLMSTRDFQCSDRRDTLYSLLSIAQNIKPQHAHLLRVDYKSTAATIATKLTLYLMHTSLHYHLRSLMFARGSRQPFGSANDEQSAPSWACSFLDDSFSSRGDLINIFVRPDFDAGRWMEFKTPTWSLSANSRVLSIRGVIVGKIDSIKLKPLGRDLNPANLKSWASAVWKAAQDCATAHAMQPEELFYDLATSGSEASRERDDDWTSDGFQASQRWLNSVLFGKKLSALKMDDPEAHSFPAGASSAFVRQLCITSTGHPGWVPPNTQEGDYVCVFTGDRFPQIISPCGEGHYNLIGGCYIQGLMWGEAYDLGMEEQLIKLY